jgi:hypothetical protein
VPQQLRAQQYPLFIVEAQEEDGPPAHWRQRDDLGFSEREVRAPTLDAGVEERDQLTRPWIAGRDIRSLKAITSEAGVGQIVERSGPAMLLADDVIRLMRH